MTNSYHVLMGLRSPALIALPRVAEYLAPLPAGVASHPQCVAKAALLRRALERRPLSRDHVLALPSALRELVACPPLDGESVPDVWLAGVLLAIADAYEMKDEEYLDWIRDLNSSMFNTLFRILMKVVSPEHLLRGAAERWKVFHRGSSLAIAELTRGRCVVQLNFPHLLFHGLALRQFAPVFEAAIQMCDPLGRVELGAFDATQAFFIARWGA
jgi:hypothetical protein